MKNSVKLIGKCTNIYNCEYIKKYDGELLLFSTPCTYNEGGYCTNEDAIVDRILQKITNQKIDKM